MEVDETGANNNGRRSNCETNNENLSRQELLNKVQKLEAHVIQLKNLLKKAQGGQVDKKLQGRKGSKPFDFSKYNTRHVALKVTYLGWDYMGFAVQEDTDKTIEAVLFEALLKTKLIESRQTSNYHRCGRTDKGVSAFCQVISIDLRTNLLEGKGVKLRENGTATERKGDKTKEINYLHILNKVLPGEVRVLAWCPMDEDFSARFSCIQRTYKYFFPKGNLDIEVMKDAANRLHGEHDYRNFCKMDVGNGVTNFVRKILHTEINMIPYNSDSRGYEMCELTVVGQAFLWHQIRCIVALLIHVGQGKEKPQVIDELLDIQNHPCKPQYSLASEIPLVLFDCQFEGVDWIYDPESHWENLKVLQEFWAKDTIKSAMLRRMLQQLEETPVSQGCGGTTACLKQADTILPGSKPRTYIPLLKRPTCESLEDRMQHYAKKGRLQIEDSQPSDPILSNSGADNV